MLSILSNTNLREVLPAVCHKYQLLFNSVMAKMLSTYTISQHTIKLTAEPKKEQIYKLSARELECLKLYIQKILAKGNIQLSKLPCSSLILFIPYKQELLWLCVNFQELFKITVKNTTVTPLMDKLMKCVQGITYFSKFSHKNEFNLICNKESDEWKKLFGTQHS